MEYSNNLEFFINGQKRNLKNVDVNTTLLEHLRINEELTGTKKSCGQGGCGACTVTVAEVNEDNKVVYKSILSCLTPIGAIDGKNVTTVEGLGNPVKGLHPVQERVAKLNGAQCGFCTSGMVNNIYSTIKIKNGEPTLKDFQESTDGHICRCTGYRPLIEAGNTFAVNCKECPSLDIEDIGKKFKKYEPSNDDPKEPSGLKDLKPVLKKFEGNNGAVWYQPVELSQLLNIKKENAGKKVRILTGNTSTGVYGRDQETEVYIYTGKVKELKEIKIDTNGLTLGSAVTIYQLLETLEKYKSHSRSFPTLITHIKKIASRHIRMNGTWTGNLFMARDRGFASDMATVMFGVGAKITLLTENEAKEERDLESFLTSTDNIVVLSITIPFLRENEYYESYRTTLRPQLSHPLVNAAYRVLCNQDKTIKEAVIVYGVVAKHAVRAKKTESFLVGKPFDEKTFSDAVDHIREEINLSKHPETQYFTVHQPEGKEEYRNNLLVHFLFKFFCKMRTNLSLPLNETYASLLQESVCSNTNRPISHGQVDFEVGEGRHAIPKMDIESLVSGQAKYTIDLPTTKKTLFGAFILGTKIGYKVKSVDVEGAKKLAGVVDVILPGDVTGKNSFQGEPIFAEKISFYGQPVALVLAETQLMADNASKKIAVEYGEQVEKDLSFTIETSMEKGSYHDSILQEVKFGDTEKAFTTSENVLEGKVNVGTQFHFYLEKQNAYAVPDDGSSMKIFCGVQAPEYTKKLVADILGVKNKDVTVISKRAGGGFGGKLTRQILICGAAAVAARKTGVPVRIELSINTDQQIVGGRFPLNTNFKIGFDNDGTIRSLTTDTHLESGFGTDFGQGLAGEFIGTITNCYYVPNFTGKVRGLKTNLPTRTAVRSFGHTEGTFVMETIIEKIATHLNLTLEEVREKNMFNTTNAIAHTGQFIDQCNIREIYFQVKKSSDFEKRSLEIEQFNKENKFKKRGISVGGIKYSLCQAFSSGATALVNVNPDGTVIVFHGGCEIGQGTHTKVALRVAEAFGIDPFMVKVGDTNTDVSVMTEFTGGSTSSEVNGEAARIACEKIKQRIAHLRFDLYKELKREPTWPELVDLAYKNRILLSETANFVPYGHENTQFRTPYSSHETTYFGFGAGCVEVEVDVLTGEMNVLRADVLYDCGNSLNPLIDLGQTEGGFVCGLGYLFREEILISNEGRVISDDTWEYKPPMAYDIPIDFRVSLLKDSRFKLGVGQSKAVGEPPMLISVFAVSALRKALKSAKQQKNLPTIDVPLTIDRIQNAFGLIDYKNISF